MDARIGLLFLFLLSGGWVSDARKLAATDILGIGGNADMCTLCEEFATLALNYIEANKTETQVIEALHEACTKMRSLEEKCIMIVDYYAPLFFLEVSSMQPKVFCKKVGFCRNVTPSSLSSGTDKCDICQRAIDDVLEKLKDPDTELAVVALLLKTCNLMEKYSKKCKSMVFEFGPLIITDAEKFIEKVDICTTFHVCSKPTAVAEEAVVDEKIEMVTSS